MRKILLAAEVTQERATLFCHVVADCTAQHWVARFNRINDGTRRNRDFNFERNLWPDARECLQMIRHSNSYTAHQSCPLRSMRFKSLWSLGIEFRNRKHRIMHEQSPFANIAAWAFFNRFGQLSRMV